MSSFTQLPLNDAFFDIDLIGEFTGKTYKGRFTIKPAISIGEQIEMEREISMYLSDLSNPTPNLAVLATMLSNIKFHTIKFPEWWDAKTQGRELEDRNVIIEIFNNIKRIQEEWKQKVVDKAKAVSPDKKEENGPLA